MKISVNNVQLNSAQVNAIRIAVTHMYSQLKYDSDEQAMRARLAEVMKLMS
jgi:hypothetical protein